MVGSDAKTIRSLLSHLTADERRELDALLAAGPVWTPLPGPQTMAYLSDADIVGYGGAAGGGKTDLIAGAALTRHTKTMVMRRVGTELMGVLDRFAELLGGKDGFNGKDNVWRTGGRQIEFGAVPNVGDETKYQGRPHDLLAFDEATNFLGKQVRFLMTWVRSTIPGQKQQMLLTFNPPSTSEGRWVIEFFAPWLDKKHPDRAKAGELRWAASMPPTELHPNGRDLWVRDGRPFVIVDGEPSYDFDSNKHRAEDVVTPKSRTFIPSRVTDNPHLMATGYLATLQALPEPLRSQMLYGDFDAGVQDDPWQVIPTAWVEAAQARWTRPHRLPPMDSVGVDVARGGKDQTIMQRRHGVWFDEPLAYPGSATPDGPKVAGLAIAAARDGAVLHVDVIGVGSSPYDFLQQARQQVVGVNVSEAAIGVDKSGRLRFRNLRSELWWRAREAFDPANNTGICIPPDPRLAADLTAPTWELSGATIKVASREEIIAKIGRSPDFGSALVLALIDTPKRSELAALSSDAGRLNHDPYR